jgi:NADH-quinone oxidoreductase subunit M
MILSWLILIPFAGGILAWLSGRINDRWPRRVSLATLVLHSAIVVVLWANTMRFAGPGGHGSWLYELNHPWLPRTGINFHLAMDGLSLLLIALTAFLGIVAVLSSWTEVKTGTGFFQFNLMWCLSGIIGVFLSLDLFLFYFFWELMLVPVYFLIAVWGHEKRTYAAIKFFVFTQLSGLFLLLGIIALYFFHGQTTGHYTFDYQDLLSTPLPDGIAVLLMLSFFVAFAVKLPVIPLHTWLPDAHTEAPTAGSVILAGLLLKTGAYGLLRFVVPLFPGPAMYYAPVGMVLGTAGILYGALLAFAQTDLKRLVAYTSVSHMGFVLLGTAAWNEIALQGVVIQLISHGISTGALFVLAGSLQERTNTRDMQQMGGLWSEAPRFGGVTLFFALASLGLPGLGNFVGEFLVLFGAFKVNGSMTATAAMGLIFATAYALWMVRKVFYGPNTRGWKVRDLSLREMTAMGLMIAALLGIGIHPGVCTKTAGTSLQALQLTVSKSSSRYPLVLASPEDKRMLHVTARKELPWH